MASVAALLLMPMMLSAAKTHSGKWYSEAAGKNISYHSTEASRPAKDAAGKVMTVVYLENLAQEKIGRNTNAEDVKWLTGQGYAVVELDYGHSDSAIVPKLNKDIIAINDQLNSGKFGGIQNISTSRAYVLFEGYRIKRNVSYCKDDPTVYNYPSGYNSGDSLYMDIIYPANPARPVPTLLSFAYANSWYGKAHQRMFLGYTFSMFDDTILEGLPGIGYAWAIADHPKYCEWGQGKYKGGANKSLASIEVCPDAAVKVRSAIRTLRHVGKSLGLGNDIGLYGFSRGSTAASLAIGNQPFADWLSTDGCRQDSKQEDCSVSVAVLGPGVFDYSLMGKSTGEYKRMAAYCHSDWTEQGGAKAIGSGAVPCFLFYNTNDDSNYDTQAKNLIRLFNSTGTPYQLLKDFGSGHAVPQKPEDIEQVYNFIQQHTTTAVELPRVEKNGQKDRRIYDLAGMECSADDMQTGIYISNGKKFVHRRH